MPVSSRAPSDGGETPRAAARRSGIACCLAATALCRRAVDPTRPPPGPASPHRDTSAGGFRQHHPRARCQPFAPALRHDGDSVTGERDDLPGDFAGSPFAPRTRSPIATARPNPADDQRGAAHRLQSVPTASVRVRRARLGGHVGQGQGTAEQASLTPDQAFDDSCEIRDTLGRYCWPAQACEKSNAGFAKCLDCPPANHAIRPAREYLRKNCDPDAFRNRSFPADRRPYALPHGAPDGHRPQYRQRRHAGLQGPGSRAVQRRRRDVRRHLRCDRGQRGARRLWRRRSPATLRRAEQSPHSQHRSSNRRRTTATKARRQHRLRSKSRWSSPLTSPTRSPWPTAAYTKSITLMKIAIEAVDE